MRKIIMYGVFGIAVLLNIYLIFVWTPEDFSRSEKNESTVCTYSTVKGIGKDEILKRLSDDEKKTLKSILEKLSTFDMENIEDDLEAGDDEHIRKAFALMDRRLSSDDYKKVIEILGGLVNTNGIKNL